jgi:hypothetical protein
MATTTPNFGWPVPTSTDLVKDGAVAIEGLGDAIDASLLDLKGGTTGQVLAKASGTDMDFSWVAQDDSNAIQNAIVDAKGDLIAATANDTPARLAVGANDTVLMAASGESTGLKWGGNWQTWTPTLTNMTQGNGTITARYRRVNNTVEFFFKFVLGSTSTMGTVPWFSLPVSLVYRDYPLNVLINDFGAGNYFGLGILADDNCYMYLLNVAGTYPVQANITSTVPMTWTTNDTLVAVGSYEVA